MGIICSVDRDHWGRDFVDAVFTYFLVEWVGFAIFITYFVAPRAVLTKYDREML